MEVASGVPGMSQGASEQPRDENRKVDGQDLGEDLDFHGGFLLFCFGMEEVKLLWVRFTNECRSGYREGVHEDVDSNQKQIIVDGSEAVCGAVD